jgi:DNA-binding GntR family transcriptional regulator
MGAKRIRPVERAESLGERAHSAIRQAIRDGTLVPHEVYSDAALGRELGISRTPVREAVQLLAHEGLVEVLPQRGFRLREISSEEAAEIFALREAIEGYVVQRLALDIEPAALRKLRNLIDRQQRAVDNAQTFLEADEAFHLLMPTLANLPRTLSMLSTLRGEMWPIAARALGEAGRGPQVIEEHTRIVDAIENQDPEGARDAMASHVRNTAAIATLTLSADRSAAGQA